MDYPDLELNADEERFDRRTTRAPFELNGHEYTGARDDPEQPDWTKVRIEFWRHSYTRAKTLSEGVFTQNEVRAFNMREFRVNGHAPQRHRGAARRRVPSTPCSRCNPTRRCGSRAASDISRRTRIPIGRRAPIPRGCTHVWCSPGRLLAP